MKNPKNPKSAAPKISPAGMRREMVRKDNNVGSPDVDSLVEEIDWRKEHRQ